VAIHFIGIGTQKGGTTTLNAYLNQHGSICIPTTELHFFDNEDQDWTNPDISLYHANFDLSSTYKIDYCSQSGKYREPGMKSEMGHICGEITPIYIYWEPCLKRIYNYNPSIKLIILLRNPFARAYSQWAMEKARGLEDLCFSEALRAEEYRLSVELPKHQHRVYSYLDRSLYFRQLKRCFNFFPRSQILILRSKDLFHSPYKCMQSITNFLEIPPLDKLIPIHARKGIYTQPMSNADWHYMADKLEDDISAVESLLSWDCSDWRHPLGVES
jgi:hypothetical protein